MKARGAPGGIYLTHLADQSSDVLRDRWAPSSTVADFPRPEQPKARPMPGDDGFRFHDHQRGPPATSNPAQPNPEEPVGGGKLRPSLGGALEYADLMTQGQVLELQRGSRFQERREGRSQDWQHSEHRTKKLTKDRQLLSSQTVRGLREAQAACGPLLLRRSHFLGLTCWVPRTRC